MTTEFQDYVKKRAALMAKTNLTAPEQIADLPWDGNHASDMPLFERCEAFKKTLKGNVNRAARKQVDKLVALHGMGIDI